jgi:hypothetical protein
MCADDPAPTAVNRCEGHTITPGCRIDCLRAVLSRGALNPLARALDAPDRTPTTVGDVIELFRQGVAPGQIFGLGRRRIGEIEASLVLAGLDIGDDGHRAHSRPAR